MREYLLSIFEEAAKSLEYLRELNITFDIPKIESQGDLSSNVAMLLVKQLKRKPRELAEEIVSALNYDKQIISKVEIAGPGFINFFFSPTFIPRIINDILTGGINFGRSNKYSGKRANVEFVSANPTGPLTVGHGRNAVFGDTVSNLLESIGYTVDREYYFNNAGRQMRVLGDSVRLRYLELLGHKSDFPEDHYQGEYIKDIAKNIYDKFGDKYINEPAEGIFKETAESEIFADIKKTLERLNIRHKIFFNENTLYEEGKITNTLNTFKEKNLSYEKDGAVWLKLIELGNEQDKVIVKTTGEPTYRLPDIAYHITKFDRGYDLMIDIFGSDHNATYTDVLADLNEIGNYSD